MDYNPFLPEVQENPYPYYAYLREHTPVYQIPGVGAYAISRYDDVMAVLKNPQMFSSSLLYTAMMGECYPFPPEAPSLPELDPPVHTIQRKIINRAFTPRRVASLEAHLREVGQELIADMAAQGQCDLIRDLAIPVPLITIAELLGVPVERRADFKRWSDTLVRGMSQTTVPPQEREGILRSNAELRAYLQEVIAGYRKQPADNLLSDLVRAEEENERLTADQLLSTAVILLVAGNETTTNLIGNAVLALLNHPQELAKAQANPALIPNLIEETLRYDSPIQILARNTTQEVEIGGTTLPAGAVAMILFGSANRDESKFADPERFDILRKADGHAAFGFGIHFCLGAELARLEAKVALTVLLERFSHLSRTDEPLTRLESVLVRGVKALPVVVR